MNWFQIDPAAEAIIHSLQDSPERWRDGENYVSFDGDPYRDATIKLWKRSYCRQMWIDTPKLSLNRRSERAIWKAYEAWRRSGQVTQEQKNREALSSALNASKGSQP